MPTAFRQVGSLPIRAERAEDYYPARGRLLSILACVQGRRNQKQTVYYAELQRTYGGNTAIPCPCPIPPFDAALRARYNLQQGSQEREVPLPLYEYKCRKCGRHVERIQKFSDPPLTTCEECAGELERLISSPAIQFKGSGWYVTDYARDSSPGAKSPSSDSSQGADKKAPEPCKPAEPAKPTPKKD